MKKLILFPYCLELFVLLKLCGVTHASYWWIPLFVLSDVGTKEWYQRV